MGWLTSRGIPYKGTPILNTALTDLESSEKDLKSCPEVEFKRKEGNQKLYLNGPICPQ